MRNHCPDVTRNQLRVSTLLWKGEKRIHDKVASGENHKSYMGRKKKERTERRKKKRRITVIHGSHVWIDSKELNKEASSSQDG